MAKKSTINMAQVMRLLLQVLTIHWLCLSTSAFAQTPIQCGQVINGTIDLLGEEDRYVFDASAGDVIALHVVETTRGFNVRVELRNPSNRLLVSGTLVEQQLLDETGTYTIVIRYASGGTRTGGYQLSWQRTKNPCNPTQMTECQVTRTSTSRPVELPGYVFNGVAGQRAVLRIYGTSLSYLPRIRLYDPDGTRIATSTSVISIVLARTGVHTVLVTSESGGITGNYTLSLGNVIVNLLSPNGGEMFLAGSPVDIRWYSDASIPALAPIAHDVQASADGGATFFSLTPGGLSRGIDSLRVDIPVSVAVNNVLVKVISRDLDGRACSDVSDAPFAIAELASGDPTVYRYDQLNRLTQVIHPDGTAINYTYDDAGNRLREYTSSAPLFRVTSNPPSLSVRQGGSVNSTVTVTSLNGFGGVVTLRCSESLPNVSCRFTPNTTVTLTPGGSVTRTLTLTASSSGSPLGTHNVQVQGVSGSLTRMFDIRLTVTQ